MKSTATGWWWVRSADDRAVDGRLRYLAAVEMQGFSFVELRTPPASLPRDASDLHVLPPVQLFGPDAHPRTADVLTGKQVITCAQ